MLSGKRSVEQSVKSGSELSGIMSSDKSPVLKNSAVQNCEAKKKKKVRAAAKRLPPSEKSSDSELSNVPPPTKIRAAECSDNSGSDSDMSFESDDVVSDEIHNFVAKLENKWIKEWAACKAELSKVIDVSIDAGTIDAASAKSVRCFSDQTLMLISSIVMENVQLSERVKMLTEIVKDNKQVFRPPLNAEKKAVATNAARGAATLNGAANVSYTAQPCGAAKVQAQKPKSKHLVKPALTYGLVVKGKCQELSSNEILAKVNEIGPSLGVRVDEIKLIRGGGVLIRTPSIAEREKIVQNKKFEQLALDVSVGEKLGSKIVVQGVSTDIPSAKFMKELHEKNFSEFKKSVRLLTAPWAQAEGNTNVVLEAKSSIAEKLLKAGRCYIQWSSCRVRSLSPVSSCFRCLAVDHRIAECQVKEDVCRRCGQQGHRAAKCTNPKHCRNCAAKGLPAAHGMLSTDCQIYGRIVDRALARQ